MEITFKFDSFIVSLDILRSHQVFVHRLSFLKFTIIYLLIASNRIAARNKLSRKNNSYLDNFLLRNTCSNNKDLNSIPTLHLSASFSSLDTHLIISLTNVVTGHPFKRSLLYENRALPWQMDTRIISPREQITRTQRGKIAVTSTAFDTIRSLSMLTTNRVMNQKQQAVPWETPSNTATFA